MSSMLEQAIVDAKSLREAAIRNAEETLVEKYSDDIKEAVEKLLEQDDEMMPAPPAALPDIGAGPEEESLEAAIPYAATAGEELCPCPDDNKPVELDLFAIKGELDALTGEGEVGLPVSHEEAAEDVMGFAEGQIADSEVLHLVEEGEEELDLSEEELTDLLEKVLVDVAPVTASWAGRPVAERAFEEEKHKAVLAQEHDIDVLTQENKKLEGHILKLQETVEVFKQRENKYNEVVGSLKQRFDEMSLANARLIYTNKVLNSDSLNERQKSRVVDAISNVNSVKEAKVIFEALQNAVGTRPAKRRGPKSLSEAVEKRNSSLLTGRRNKQPKSDVPDSAKSRMQRLAGIK